MHTDSITAFAVVRVSTQYGPTTHYSLVGDLCETRDVAEHVMAAADRGDRHRPTGLRELGHNEAGRSYRVCEVVHQDVDLNDLWDMVDRYTDLNAVVLPEQFAARDAGDTRYADANNWLAGDEEAVQACVNDALGRKGLALVTEEPARGVGRTHIVRVSEAE